MKANNNPAPNSNTFVNRVAKFEKDQIKNAPLSPKSSKKSTSTDAFQTYVEARVKVLASYSESDRADILKMEKSGQTNNVEYNRFIYHLLIAAGDEPTADLRKSTETCGCYLCKLREENKSKKS